MHRVASLPFPIRSITFFWAVRFTPESGHARRERHVRFGPLGDMRRTMLEAVQGGVDIAPKDSGRESKMYHDYEEQMGPKR